MTPFVDVVTAAEAVAATTKRTEKKAALADLLARLEPDEIEIVIGFLTGAVRQGRFGIGWATIRKLDVAPSTQPSLTISEVDRSITAIAALSGEGSQAARADALHRLYARATETEADFLSRLFIGELRTGALEGVVTDAIAAAATVKLAIVRRAAMLAGDLALVANLALVGGEEAVAAVGLEPLRAVGPMLASTSESVAAAMADVGEASVEWKLDGARIQVHRAGWEVRIYTRNLNDVSDRLPEVVALARQFPASSFVLDGEVLGFMGPDESPEAFQDTISRFSTQLAPELAPEAASAQPGLLVPQFFDLLHVDGDDLIDTPLRHRRERLGDLVGSHLIPGEITSDVTVAEAVLADSLERGHEGVMVKAADSPYEAGRRGKSWRKVKPVYTFDLVVLAVEWGSGRRRGWLSNIHLGARDPGTGEFVMVGKTFKGMTDEMLMWQTERFSELSTGESGHIVHVTPVQVVEVAIDGVQASTRYPGGLALRFARVKRYRHDKDAAEADTIDALHALLRRRSE